MLKRKFAAHFASYIYFMGQTSRLQLPVSNFLFCSSADYNYKSVQVLHSSIAKKKDLKMSLCKYLCVLAFFAAATAAELPPINCAVVLCALPECAEDETTVVPEGQCCPICVPNVCPVKGQVFSSCAGCGTTCARIINDEILFCPAVCREGCTCPGGQVVDTANNECVEPDECPNPCATRFCPSGSRCKIYEPTGESFCDPSCDINNGGCSANQICSLNVVQCIRAPCPPQVVCTDPADVCGLSPEAGPCKAYFPRYFHNATSGQCEKFIYGGCQGNRNNFETLEACRDQCVCGLPPETGLCKAAFPRYFYNSTSEQCERFTYGGCGGNSNNFETLSECNNVCSDVCSLPAETGPCRAYIPRYFYNSQSGQCEKFIYGGCQGNANNFETLEDCQNACAEESTEPPTISPCATIKCANGYRCEVFEGKGYCRADCNINNGGCSPEQTCRLQDVVCVKAPCFPVRVCEDPPTCPPTCGEETCAGQHPSTQCSSPGPFEIPGCTGSCKLSYCGACYVREANTTIEPPSGLDQCRVCENPATEYSSNTACYRRWARCAWRRHRKQFGPVDFNDIPASSSVECYIPPGCPFKG